MRRASSRSAMKFGDPFSLLGDLAGYRACEEEEEKDVARDGSERKGRKQGSKRAWAEVRRAAKWTTCGRFAHDAASPAP